MSEIMKTGKKRKISTQQKLIFLHFLQEYPRLLHSKLKPSYSGQQRQNLWKQLSDKLNLEASGPVKNVRDWRKTLSDWKLTVKRTSEKNGAEVPLVDMSLLELIGDVSAGTKDSKKVDGAEDVTIPDTSSDREIPSNCAQQCSSESEERNVQGEADESPGDLESWSRAIQIEAAEVAAIQYKQVAATEKLTVALQNQTEVLSHLVTAAQNYSDVAEGRQRQAAINEKLTAAIEKQTEVLGNLFTTIKKITMVSRTSNKRRYDQTQNLRPGSDSP